MTRHPGDNLPRRGNALTRALGRATLCLCGWRVQGRLPDLPRFVAIGAPHSSNWDFVLMLALVFSWGIEIRWLGKHTLFRGPFGPVMRWLGGIPVNRTVASGVVGQSVAAFRREKRLILALSPEGSRSRVRAWRTGFYHMAREAGVPIVLLHVDYPRRLLGVGPVFHPGADVAADLARIREYYGRFRGKRGKRWDVRTLGR